MQYNIINGYILPFLSHKRCSVLRVDLADFFFSVDVGLIKAIYPTAAAIVTA